MPARQESCCFTGHRAAKLPWGYNESDPRCVRLKERIADAVLLAYQEGYRHFLCGMAQGCDLYFCEAVLALRDGVAPPTIGYKEPDPDCDLDYVPNQAREAALDMALSVSLGFGGHNACVAFTKAE